MTKEKKIGDKKIRLIKGDITDLDVEAFVFDIRSDAKLGTGYGGAIMTRGGKKIQNELDAIGHCPKGGAIITSAGRMKSKHIIYLNGPKFHEEDQEGKLKRAVESALRLAEENSISKIAFPPVGTGFYQVDLGLCSRVMVDTVTSYLRKSKSLKEVVFVALDTREYDPFATKIGG